MVCIFCGRQNREDAIFCDKCGRSLSALQIDKNVKYFGIFYPSKYGGGYGDYQTSFGFVLTAELAMKWVNNPASLSLSTPNDEYYLGEVSMMDLRPDDPEKHIDTRWQLHQWWQLSWDEKDKKWVKPSAPLAWHIDSIGLSNFESTQE